MKAKTLIGYVVLASGQWPTRLAYRIFNGRRRFHLVAHFEAFTCFTSRSAASIAIQDSRLFHEADGTMPPVYQIVRVEPS